MADGTDKAAHDARSLAVFADAYLRVFADLVPEDFSFAVLDTHALLTKAHRWWTGTDASLAHGTDPKKGIRTHSILVPRDLAALAAEVAKKNPLAAAGIEVERMRRYDPLSRDYLAERGRIAQRVGSLLEQAGHLGGAALKYRAAQQLLTEAGLSTSAAEARTSGLGVLDRIVHHLEAKQGEVRAAAASADDPVVFNRVVGRRMRITPGTRGWDTEMTAVRTKIHAMTAEEHGPSHTETVEAARALVEHLNETGDHHEALRFGKEAMNQSWGPLAVERSILSAPTLYRSLVRTVLAEANGRTSPEDARNDPRTRAVMKALAELPHGLGADVRTALDRARATGDRAAGKGVVHRAVDNALRNHRNRYESARAALSIAVQRARISDRDNPDEAGYLGGARPLAGPRGGFRDAVNRARTAMAARRTADRRTPRPSPPAHRPSASGR